MSKTYLSGPMSGHPELNFPAFHAKAAELRAKGIDVVNPAEIPQPNPECHKSCMREDLRYLLDCHVIYMLPGWQDSPGAKFERLMAEVIGCTVEYA